MNEGKRICFIIMPFVPELHYFYLYLKDHIERKHAMLCERGDAQVLTTPLLEKIRNYIRSADVIIADCSGRNPNVFYELGMAHAYGKKVILITKDPVEVAPTDVRHYEFIQYKLDKHTDFLSKLDNALHNVFLERYKSLYERAKKVFREFKKSTKIKVDIASEEDFFSRVISAESRQSLPPMDDQAAINAFVLPRIIADSTDVEVMRQITKWLTEN